MKSSGASKCTTLLKNGLKGSDIMDVVSKIFWSNMLVFVLEFFTLLTAESYGQGWVSTFSSRHAIVWRVANWHFVLTVVSVPCYILACIWF